MNKLQKFIGSRIVILSVFAGIMPVLLCSPAAFARGAGTSSAAILKIDNGARPMAMGGAFCAVSDDVNAIQYNPAGLNQLRRNEVMATHNEWFEGVRSEFLGIGVTLTEWWSLGMSVNYLYATGLIRRDLYTATLEGSGEFGGYTGVASFAAATKLNDEVSAGFGVKVIQESVDKEKAVGYAADLGVLYRITKFKFGVSASNLGTKIKLAEDSFPLPVTIRAGAAYSGLVDNLLIALDVNKPLDNEIGVFAGAEYWIIKRIALRAGYRSNVDKNLGHGVSAGLGFGYDNFQLDYSYLPFGDFGDTHRISLNYRFGFGRVASYRDSEYRFGY